MSNQDTSFISSSTKAHQRAVVLAALRVGPVSTLDARESLGVLGIAPRILELRRAGFDIRTERVRQVDSFGAMHTVARYVLEGQTCSES